MRLILAEDAVVFRTGLSALLTALGHRVLAAEEHGGPVPALVARLRPDAVILDIRMPPTFTDEGLGLARRIRARHPGVGVLVLSEFAEPAYAAHLLDGERRAGYLLKASVLDATVLDDALARIVAGEVVVDRLLTTELLHGAGPLPTLTDREREVLALLAQGRSDRGIAAVLGISAATVATHVKAVFRKLDLPGDGASNRRVIATLRWLERAGRMTPGDAAKTGW